MGMTWRQTSYQDKRVSNKFDGGLNNGFNPFDIAENQSTSEKGIDTEKHPAIKTFKKPSTYGATGSAQTNLLTNYQNTHLVRAVGFLS